MNLLDMCLNWWLCSFLFGKDSLGIVANCSLCSTDATYLYLAGPVCLSFSVKTCAMLQIYAGCAAPISLPFFSCIRLMPSLLSDFCFYLKLSRTSSRNYLLFSCFLLIQALSPVKLYISLKLAALRSLCTVPLVI